jgi:tetratricopeptide (TPR) repeat protein
VIDDLQWGDGDSADLLTEVLRGPDAPPLLFIASYRGDEVKSSPFLRGFLTPATLAHLRVTDLVVDQLSPDESRELARVLLLATAPRLVEIAPAIAAEAAGSPFFIDELVRAAEAAADRRAPDRAPIEGDGLDTAAREATLAQMIQVRLARLPAEAQRVLQLIAVNGQPIPAPVLRTAAGAGVWERSSVVLTAHHLIRTRETGRSSANDEVETYHDRIRETVVRALDPALLRQHHQALALAFEAAQADAELLADHFLAVGDDPRAASYALQAAETAERSLAFDRAARLYQRVVGLLGDGSPQIGGVYERLGGALVNAGRGRDAANAYFAAARCDPGRARDTKGKAAQQLLFSGHIDEGLAALNEVLASIDMRLPETRMGTMAALLWGRFRLRLRGLRFTERPEHAVDAEAINRIDICFSVAMGLAVVDTVRGIVFQTRQLLLALDAGEKHRVVRAVIWEAGFTASRGSRTRARTQKLMDLSARLAADVDTPYARALLSTCIGIAAYLNGEWKKSIKFTLEAADMLRGQCTGVAHDINNANFFALWSQFWVGDFRAIRTRYPVLLKDALERGDRYAETMYLVFLSHYYYLAADEPELARRTSHEAMRNWSQAGFHIQHCWEMWAQIEIALYEGRGSLAWLTANRVWAELEHSLLLRIQQMTICMVDLKGRAAIAAASDASSAGERRRLLRIAARAASRMDRQRTAWGSALAGFLRTGIAAVQGDAASVQRGLERSAQAFDRLDMALVATVARRRLGELTDRADLVAASDLWMREQGIGHPERMARMLAPWTIARRSGTAAAVSPAI